MLHPDTELRFVDPIVGHGVFAVRDIPKGTITWARDRFDRVFSPAEVATFDDIHAKLIDRYGYQDGNGDTVLCWDHGRFVNHSCEATCLSPGFDFEIAVRDIAAGTELTDDYGSLGPTTDFPCHCREPSCRKVVRPDDYTRLTEVWDAKVRAAFPLIRSVSQPLWNVVRDRDAVLALLDAGKPPPTGLVHQHAARSRRP